MSRIMMQVRGQARPLTFGGGAPLQVAAFRGWTGVPFEVHRIGSSKGLGTSGPRPGEHGLMIVTGGGFETVVRGPRGPLSSRSTPGSMQFMSGDTPAYVEEVRGAAEVVALDLTPAWLRYLQLEPGRLGRTGPLPGGRTAQALVSAMRDELARACTSGRLYAESLSLSLLSYACSFLPPPELPDACRLSAPERARVDDYVRAHLDRDLGLPELAALVGLSPRRFGERFRNTFHMTPHRYVMQLRLTEGARLLAGGHDDIAEIALRVGFCSQSHFTAAFRRAFSDTPARYARRRGTIA